MDSRVGSGRLARYLFGRGRLVLPALTLALMLTTAMGALASPQQGQSRPGQSRPGQGRQGQNRPEQSRPEQQSVSMSQAEVMKAVATAEAALMEEEAPPGNTAPAEGTAPIATTLATRDSGVEKEAPAKEWPDLSPWRYRPSNFNLSARGGVGLMLTVSPYTLDSGEIAMGVDVLNYDRYPGDIDVVDVPFQFAVGLPGRTELFFQISPVIRTNSVGQDPVGYPIPPLDLFIDTYPDSALRPEPYFMIAQDFPYKTYAYPAVIIDPPGNGAFARSSGDIVFGFKANALSEERGQGVGLGFRAYVEIPTETPDYNTYAWRHHAGVSGEIDYGFDVLLAKTVGRAELLFNGGYKKLGDPERGLIVQYVDSSATTAEDFLVGAPLEMGLDLRDQAFLAVGLSIHAFDIGIVPVWFMTEYSSTLYVGGGTPVERKVHPQELRLGLQCNLPWASEVSLGFAWQLLFNDAGDGSLRSSNFLTPDGARGDINFSELVDPELSREVQEYLSNLGATFSYNSSKMFSTNNPAFDSWRNVSTDPQTVIGQGGGAAIFFLTWRIGSLW